MIIYLYINGPHTDWIFTEYSSNSSIKIVKFENYNEQYNYNLKTISSREDVAISIHWPIKFEQDFLISFRYALNVHPGYLPVGRGTFPIFWNILEQTTAGATVHQMTSEIDDGPILFREAVLYGKSESSGELWKKVNAVEKILIKRTIKQLLDNGELNFFTINEAKKPARKKSEFLQLLNSPPTKNLTTDEINRYLLAFTHHDHEIPGWMSNFNTRGH